jgi:hypothetical protein
LSFQQELHAGVCSRKVISIGQPEEGPGNAKALEEPGCDSDSGLGLGVWRALKVPRWIPHLGIAHPVSYELDVLMVYT